MITLVTTVYDGNLDTVLDPNGFFMMWEGQKMLLANNVSREKLQGVEDVVFVEDHAEEAKKFFNLDIDENTKGYYYTIQYFVLLLKCPTKYFLNVSSDCTLNWGFDFIGVSILELQDEDILTTTLEWQEGVGKLEAVKESENFYHSKGFSDQVFIGDVDKLKNVDYNIQDEWNYYGLQEGFVHHGGNSFERRLATYMKNHNKYRGIYKKYSYKHD